MVFEQRGQRLFLRLNQQVLLTQANDPRCSGSVPAAPGPNVALRSGRLERGRSGAEARGGVLWGLVCGRRPRGCCAPQTEALRGHRTHVRSGLIKHRLTFPCHLYDWLNFIRQLTWFLIWTAWETYAIANLLIHPLERIWVYNIHTYGTIFSFFFFLKFITMLPKMIPRGIGGFNTPWTLK